MICASSASRNGWDSWGSTAGGANCTAVAPPPCSAACWIFRSMKFANMLSRMLDISVHEIRRWERTGLIKAVAHVCRLPFFDFQEVAGARRLAELVDAGVPVREI